MFGVVVSSEEKGGGAARQPPVRDWPPPCRLRPPALVTEWVGGGTLDTALGQPDHPLLRCATARLQLLLGVAEGMAHLHSQGVVHFNLTSRSVLLPAADGREPRALRHAKIRGWVGS